MRQICLSFICVTLLLFGFVPYQAYAQCTATELTGTWRAPNALKGEPIRLELQGSCADHNARYGQPKSHLMVRAFHKCYPRNCIWGRAEAKLNNKGIYRATFQTFSAQRIVDITPGTNSITVSYVIDYLSKKRPMRKGKMTMWREK